MINYQQALALARIAGIEPAVLSIAEEVNYQLENRDMESNLDPARFEDYCTAVYDIYLESKAITVEDATRALFFCIDEGKADIDTVLDYGKDWQVVFEYACAFAASLDY